VNEFGEKWMSWIQTSISIVCFSVLVNDTPSGFFNSSRGLRQSDSLSPLLFFLVMEILSRTLVRAVGRGYTSGFRMGKILLKAC
jgi:hypothetical protein